MEPIEIALSLELGSLILAGVAGIATWVHHRQVKALRRQRERHHQEMRALTERHHQERMRTMRQTERVLEKEA